MMLHCLSWWWCKPDATDQWLLGSVQHINMFCLSCKASFKKLNDLSKFLNWKILLKSPILGCSWKFRWSGNSKPIFPMPASAGPEQALWALDRVCVSRFLIPTWSPLLIHNTFPPTPEGIWIHDPCSSRGRIPYSSVLRFQKKECLPRCPSSWPPKRWLWPLTLSFPCFPLKGESN